MKGEKYLPIGTVVMLKEGTKRAMIIGFCTMGNNEEKIYDYSGCIYPEGMIASNQILLFDHNQIEKIYHLGFEDEEEQQFKDKLNKLMDKVDNSNL